MTQDTNSNEIGQMKFKTKDIKLKKIEADECSV